MLKRFFIFLACLLLPASLYAEDILGMGYIFTAMFPSYFIWCCALACLALTVFLYNHDGRYPLRKTLSFLIYTSYTVTALSVILTLLLAIAEAVYEHGNTLFDPESLWLSTGFSGAVLSTYLVFLSHKALKKPSPEGFLKAKLCLASFFVLLFLYIAGNYAYYRFLAE